MTKINKALDYNKLLNDQKQGKMLKKSLTFPLIAHIKYDGNYVVVEVNDSYRVFHTSGGLTYTHTDNAGKIFEGVANGFYLAERIHGAGKLGDRNRCNLHGSKDNQKSTGHSYKVFDFVSTTAYCKGATDHKYVRRRGELVTTGVAVHATEIGKYIHNEEDLELYRQEICDQGYEGLMLYAEDYKWAHHKTRRTTKLTKYKKRPTADLLCIGWKEGTGKYEGMTGSLLMQDSKGRQVYVGSGMNDDDRSIDPSFFIGEVIEIEYEQIVDTYIQATHSPENDGVLVRLDKTSKEID